MKKMMGIALVALAMASPALAADVTGTWKLTGTIGQGMPLDIACTFKVAEKKVTGACKAAQMPDLNLTGDTDGTTLNFSYPVSYQGQDMTITYAAKIDSATAMKGTISVMGQDAGTFTGTKQ